MEAKELLKNEKVERVLSPHPLSFVKEQSLCLFLIIWGLILLWLVNASAYKDLFSGNGWYTIILWGLVMLLFGVILSLIEIKWTAFFLYFIVFFVGIIIIITQNWVGASNVFVPSYTVTVSIIGFLFVDAYRRTHKYIITNQRIKLKGGIFTKRERILSHDKILDLTEKQGILGQIFDFGTITPITQHEFIPKGEKFLKLERLKSKKKKAKQKEQDQIDEEEPLQAPTQKSYYELHGVYPYKEVKKFVEEMVHDTSAPTKSITTYQKEQHEFLEQQRSIQKAIQPEKFDIQKEMKKLPATQTKKTRKQQPVVAAEQEEEEEAVPSEQLDIQKEMKELLKKQGDTKEEEKDEEETETEEKS